VRQLRNHGIAANPLCSIPGFNAKLDEVRAAIALTQLQQIDAAIARRRDYGERLRGFIAQAGLADIYQLQQIPAGVRSNFQNHGVLCPAALSLGRDTLIAALAEQGVGARPYFHPALHRLEGYRDQDYDLPVTEQVWSSWICLPLHARMSERDLVTIERGLLAVAERITANAAACS
jgi:dTDP-4-amino-4,6-dideoxygalactose transaminase